MVAFRKPKSLRDILVRAIVRTQQNETNECKGCGGRSDCQVCKLLIKGNKFSNMSKTRDYNLRKGTLHCNSCNVVYLMTCKTCEKQYVGCTTTRFRKRLNNYKSKLRLYYNRRKSGKLDKFESIPQANLFEHVLSHENIKGFDSGKKKDEDWNFWSFLLIDSSPNEPRLLERESFWQHLLQTFLPLGLNEKEVSLKKF